MLFAATADEGISILSMPGIQYGFAAFAFVLLAIIVWAFKQILQIQKETNLVLKETNQVLIGVNAVIQKACDSNDETHRLMKDIHDKLLERPCLLKKPTHPNI